MLAAFAALALSLAAEPKPYTVEFVVLRVPAGSNGVRKLFEGQPTRMLLTNGSPTNSIELIDADGAFTTGRTEMRGPTLRVGQTSTTSEVIDAAWLVWPGWTERPQPFGSDFNWYRGPRAYIARTPCTFTASAVAAENGRSELTISYAALNLVTPENRRPLPPTLAPFFAPDAPPPRQFVPAFYQQLKLSDSSQRRVTEKATLKVGETFAMHAGYFATWPASDELLVPYRHRWGFYNMDALDDVIVFATVRE